MSWISRRPAGIAIIALLLVLTGLASLVESAQLITAAAGWPDAIVAAVMGLLLLYRAFGLWQLRQSAWLITVLLLALKTVATAAEIVRGQTVSSGWLAIGSATVSLLYLLHPSVRPLFSANHSGM